VPKPCSSSQMGACVTSCQSSCQSQYLKRLVLVERNDNSGLRHASSIPTFFLQRRFVNMDEISMPCKKRSGIMDFIEMSTQSLMHEMERTVFTNVVMDIGEVIIERVVQREPRWCDL
jgi:hypothetical protein